MEFKRVQHYMLVITTECNDIMLPLVCLPIYSDHTDNVIAIIRAIQYDTVLPTVCLRSHDATISVSVASESVRCLHWSALQLFLDLPCQHCWPSIRAFRVSIKHACSKKPIEDNKKRASIIWFNWEHELIRGSRRHGRNHRKMDFDRCHQRRGVRKCHQ